MDATKIIEIVIKLLIKIFQNYEVDKEFEALGIDIEAILNSFLEKE